MGHRALVAYEQPDGTYDVHYSHWGALDCQLAEDDALTKEHPYGKADITPGFVNDLVDALTQDMGDDVTIEGNATKEKKTAVDSDPHATDVGIDELPDLVAFDHECLYLVDRDFDVTAYVPKFIGGDELALIEVQPNRYDMVYYEFYQQDDETESAYRKRLVEQCGNNIPDWSPVR